MFDSGETVGLAEWIIDDTCLVPHIAKTVKDFNFGLNWSICLLLKKLLYYIIL